MSFDVAQFSNAGLNALAELTAQKTLKIMAVYADMLEHQASDLDESPSWWASQTELTMGMVNADIFSVSVANGQARIVVNLSLKQTQLSTVNVKTVVVCACTTEAGVDGNPIVLCGIMDPNGIDVVYNASHINVTTKVSLYFKFNNASSITVQNAYAPDYALHSELSRFVSCYSANDASVGDMQGIKGVKRFEDTTMFGNLGSGKCKMTISHDDQYHYTSLSAYTQVGNNDPIAQTLTFYAYENETDFYNSITTNVTISPDHANAQSDINLGTDEARFTEVNSESLYSSYATVDEEIYIKHGRHTPQICTISANDGTMAVKTTTESGWSIHMNATNATVEINSNITEINSPTNITGSLYTSDNITAGGNVNISGALNCTTGLMNLHFAPLSINPTDCSLIPVKFNIKRGNIFLAKVTNTQVSPSIAVTAGALIQASLDVYIAQSRAMTNNYTPQFIAGRQLRNSGAEYRAMCDIESLTQGQSALCLVMVAMDVD